MVMISINTQVSEQTAVSNLSERTSNNDSIDNKALSAENELRHSKQALEQVESSKEDLIDEVKSNLTKVGDLFPVNATNVAFEFDENDNQPVVKVIDKASKEIIREIPSEEFREMAKALDEFAEKLTSKGLIFDRTV
jgi:flagellar protein FlaG